MRTKILITIFAIAISNTLSAQKRFDNKEMVGFACFFAGTPSKTIKIYIQKLNNKNYKWISKQLKSKNKAEQFMSVITLEKLTELKKYKLNETEMKLISKIKKSEELVSVCAGCTYFQKVKLKTLFTNEKLLRANSWLNNILNKE